MENKSKAILGMTGSGKTTKLIQLYKEYLNNGISSNDILVLVRNRTQGILWRQNLDLSYSSKLRITSYFGLVQGELHRFWPLINKTLGSKYQGIEPIFINMEISQYIMLQLVEKRRIQGKLQALQIDNDRISMELINNLSRAALAAVDNRNIGEVLLNSREQNIMDRELYLDIQKLCSDYINQCKNLGVLDYAMAVELYNNNLLNKEAYRKHFLNNTRHIMADDLEESAPTEIKMLEKFMDKVESFTITCNTDGELGRSLGASPELVEKFILPECEVSILEKTCIGSDQLDELKMILGHMEEINPYKVPEPIIIEKDLRSEMVKSVGEKVLQLIDEGSSPSEIAIISPSIDRVTFYYIEDILKKKGVELTNLARDDKLTDDAYVKALITTACIAHPQWGLYPNHDNLNLVLSMILDMDRIRSHLISLEITKQKPYYFPNINELPKDLQGRIGDFHLERYHRLVNWIKNYQEKGFAPINHFFMKFFTEILAPLPDTEQHLEACRQLIDNSGYFLKVMKDSQAEVEKRYVELILKGMKASQSLIELKAKLHGKNVIVATPYSYLNMKQERSIQLWMDTSSQDWFSSHVKEISNPHVFHPEWERDRVWTDKDNEEYGIREGRIYISRLINRCRKKIIFCRSQLNKYGYEQDGILSERLDELQSLIHKEQRR